MNEQMTLTLTGGVVMPMAGIGTFSNEIPQEAVPGGTPVSQTGTPLPGSRPFLCPITILLKIWKDASLLNKLTVLLF